MSHDITFYRKTRVLYLPKYYFITVYFRNCFGCNDGDIFNLTKSDVYGLLERCRKVDEDHSLARKLLPLKKYYMDKYDERYFGNVKDTIRCIEDVLLPLFDTLKSGECLEFELSC